MEWQTPKTNWQAADVVSKDDFNRIEGNIQHLQDTKETPAGAQAKAEAAAGAVQAELDAHKADYVRQPAYAVTSGTSTAYTVTLDPAPATIPEGFAITIVPHVDCGASPTLNINGKGAIALRNNEGEPLVAGDLLAGVPYNFRRVGVNFIASSGGGVKINGVDEVQAYFGDTISKGDPVKLVIGAGDMVIDTKLPDPSSLPTGRGYGVSFSPDSNYMAVGHDASPYITIYKPRQTAIRTGNNILALSNAVALGYAKEAGISGETKTIIRIWRG